MSTVDEQIEPVRTREEDADAMAPAASTVATDGAVAAALLATGVACAVMGIVVVATNADPAFRALLTRVWSPGGPLPGKALVATLAGLASWIVLHWSLRGRGLSGTLVRRITFALIGVGVLGTFPPFYYLFL